MKTIKIQDITFDTEDAITAAALKNSIEMIVSPRPTTSCLSPKSC
jgi:hypothetical protein